MISNEKYEDLSEDAKFLFDTTKKISEDYNLEDIKPEGVNLPAQQILLLILAIKGHVFCVGQISDGDLYAYLCERLNGLSEDFSFNHFKDMLAGVSTFDETGFTYDNGIVKKK